MINIDREKCTGCGTCTRICHESCIELVDNKPAVNPVYCSSCSQCAAICPVQAISWNTQPTIRYDAALLPSIEQLDEMFKQRRSIRLYEDKLIEKQVLAEIINYGTYAPTHNYTLRAVVVDEKAVIQQFDQILVRFVSLIYRVAYRPKVIEGFARLLGMQEEYLLNKPKVEGVINKGKAFNYPAAIVFIVGDKKMPLSIDSAQYALANMMYYAQLKGIASCLWGNAPIFMDRSPKARKILKLKKQDRIFGALFLGHPAVKFRNKVEGRAMPMQWIGIS